MRDAEGLTPEQADDPVPHDAVAERALLGVVIDFAGYDNVAALWRSLPDDAFWDPRCEAIASTITRLFARNLVPSPQAIQADMRTELGTDHRLEQLSRFLVTLVAQSQPFTVAEHYAEHLTRLAALRQVQRTSRRALQLVRHIGESGDYERFTEVIAEVRASLDEAEKRTAATSAPSMMSLAELLEQEVEYDWLVPDLLERMDRCMFTGPEGSGKSELVHQFAMCLAGGLHPWTGRPLFDDGRGLRVVVADAENTEKQLIRRLGRHAHIVDGLRVTAGLEPYEWAETYHHLVVRPEGFELTSDDETARLSYSLDHYPADLLVIGPVYKLTTADVNDATMVRRLLGNLDKLRVRHHCAILMEHHPGHAVGPKGGRSMRPAGSSLFQRWPEFGFGLKRLGGGEIVLQEWRGQREQRAWPAGITRAGALPWSPADDDYWIENG